MYAGEEKDQSGAFGCLAVFLGMVAFSGGIACVVLLVAYGPQGVWPAIESLWTWGRGRGAGRSPGRDGQHGGSGRVTGPVSGVPSPAGAQNQLAAQPKHADEQINRTRLFDGRKTIEHIPGHFMKEIRGTLVVRIPKEDVLYARETTDQIAADLASMAVRLSESGDGIIRLLGNAAKLTSQCMVPPFMKDEGQLKSASKVAYVQEVTHPITIEIVDVRSFTTAEDTVIYSRTRFEHLGQGARNYGVTVSANAFEPSEKRFLCAEWKQIAVDHYPSNGSLITEGAFRGFVVLDNGDLFVPGLAFYRDVLAGDIDLAQYERLRFHFRDGFPELELCQKQGDLKTAKHILDDLLAHDKLRDFHRGLLHLTYGSILEEKAKITKDGKLFAFRHDELSMALDSYLRAIRCFPRLYRAYFRLFACHNAVGDRPKAEAALQLAVQYAPEEKAKEYRAIQDREGLQPGRH